MEEEEGWPTWVGECCGSADGCREADAYLSARCRRSSLYSSCSSAASCGSSPGRISTG